MAQSRESDSEGGERGSYSLREDEARKRRDANGRSGEIEESNNGSSDKVLFRKGKSSRKNNPMNDEVRKESREDGVRYSRGNYIRVSKQEYAVIAHQIMTYPKKTERNHVFTANNYYLCADITEDGGFTIIASLPIVGNEDLINELRYEQRTQNLWSLRTPARVDNLIGEVERRGGRTYRNSSNTKRIRNSRRNRGVGSVALSRETNSGRSERGINPLREDEAGKRRDANDRVREIDTPDTSSDKDLLFRDSTMDDAARRRSIWRRGSVCRARRSMFLVETSCSCLTTE